MTMSRCTCTLSSWNSFLTKQIFTCTYCCWLKLRPAASAVNITLRFTGMHCKRQRRFKKAWLSFLLEIFLPKWKIERSVINIILSLNNFPEMKILLAKWVSYWVFVLTQYFSLSQWLASGRALISYTASLFVISLIYWNKEMENMYHVSIKL